MKTFGKILGVVALVAGAGFVGHKYGDNIISGTKNLWGKVFSKTAETACDVASETKAE